MSDPQPDALAPLATPPSLSPEAEGVSLQDVPPARRIAAIITIAWNAFFLTIAGPFLLIFLVSSIADLLGAAVNGGSLDLGILSIALILLLGTSLHVAGVVAGLSLNRVKAPARAWWTAVSVHIISVLAVFAYPKFLPISEPILILLWIGVTGFLLGLVVPPIALILLFTRGGRSALAPSSMPTLAGEPASAATVKRAEPRAQRLLWVAGILIGLGGIDLLELFVFHPTGITSPPDVPPPPPDPTATTVAWVVLGVMALLQAGRVAVGVLLVQRRIRAWVPTAAIILTVTCLGTSLLAYASVVIFAFDQMPSQFAPVPAVLLMGNDSFPIELGFAIGALTLLILSRKTPTDLPGEAAIEQRFT